MSRRFIAYGLVVLIVGVPAIAILGWLLVDTEPSGYTRRSDYSAEELETEAGKLVEAVNPVINSLLDESGGTPFEINVTDHMVTSHLRVRRREVRKRLPSWLSNPQVVFRDGTVVLMGEVSRKGADSVLSLHVRMALRDDGRLTLHLSRARAGRLPMPESLQGLLAGQVDRRIEEVERKLSRVADRHHQLVEAERAALRALARLNHGEDAVVDPREWGVQIDRLEITPGRLHVAGNRTETRAEE